MSRTEAQLLGVIAEIYDAPVDPERWPAICRRLGDLFKATGFNIQVNDLRQGTAPIYVTSGIDPAAGAAYVEQFAKTDPRVLHSIDRPLGQTRHDYEFISESEMARHPYYDFLGQWGFRYHGGGPILRAGDLLGNASFQRSRQQGPATIDDIDLLDRILPHIGRALELQLRLEALGTRVEALEQGLERTPFGAVLLDARGSICYLNGHAARMVSADDGLLADGDGLRAQRSGDNQRLQALIGPALGVAAGTALDGGGTVSIPRRSGKRPFLVTVIPLGPDAAAMAFSAPAALVVVTDGERRTMPSADALRAGYDLSDAEIAICRLLLDGASVGRIAAQREVAVRTVRAQLESIYRKTGTGRQAELICVLMALNQE